MPTTDQLIHRHARLGLVSRPRLLSLGISDEQILGRLERGSLRLIHPGVYATFGTPLDDRARTLAACLAAGPGAVASHRTALSMVEIDGLDAHGSRQALDHDLARQNLLMRHGYLVLRYTTTHLRRPAAVVREIVDACRPRISAVQQRSAA